MRSNSSSNHSACALKSHQGNAGSVLQRTPVGCGAVTTASTRKRVAASVASAPRTGCARVGVKALSSSQALREVGTTARRDTES